MRLASEFVLTIIRHFQVVIVKSHFWCRDQDVVSLLFSCTGNCVSETGVLRYHLFMAIRWNFNDPGGG